MTAACPSCGQRRGKRACPALHAQICAVCCGTKRQTEIACPPECTYLALAKTHPPVAVKRRHERDLQFLLPVIRDLSDAQYRLLLMLQAFVLRDAEGTMPRPLDVDVAEAAASVAATLETARKGIIYEHHAKAVPAQRLAAGLLDVLKDMTGRAGAHAGRVEQDAVVALRSIESMARTAAAVFPEDAEAGAAWLTFASRLMRGIGIRSEAQDTTPEPPRIVLP